MSETNKTLQQVITPFADMDEVCKALFLVKTFSVHGYAFCLNKLNASLNRDIDMRHFELFLERIKIFSTFFPVKFLNDMEKMQSSYMPEKNEVFRPSISQCLNCNKSLQDASETIYQIKVYRFGKKSNSGSLISLKCKFCESKHFLSYAIISETKIKKFYNDSLNSHYIAFSAETVFEALLLKSVTIDLMFKHASFVSLVGAHNSLLDNNPLEHRGMLIDKRLSEAWLYYNLLLFHFEYFSSLNEFNAPSIENLDKDIKNARKYLFPFFVNKWTGIYHKSICSHVSCSKAINIDGNHKCNRLTCMFDGYVYDSDEIKGC
jgi:hypothetical protein